MRSGKWLWVGFLVVLAASTLMLLNASLNPGGNTSGTWDIVTAGLIALGTFALFSLNKSKPEYETSHRAALYLLPLVLLSVWVLRNAVDLNLLLPGLAWRTFFFLYTLPYGLNVWKQE
jgi:hypothetical protein